MGQINSTNLPEYVPEAQPGRSSLRTSSDSSGAGAAETAPPQDDFQLTRLSTVLSGLKKSASTVRSQVTQVVTAVRGGTYQIDPLEVSRSIVGDALTIP